MSKKIFVRSQRAFTIVELLVVIGIIGILATIGVVSYSGVQKSARDNQRKTDLAAIGTAYKMHYQDTKNWFFVKTNSADAVAFAGTTATTEGSGGQGWFNFQGANQVSMANALMLTKYLSESPRDPSVSSDTTGVGGSVTPPHQYMKYLCYDSTGLIKQGIILLAQLENPGSLVNGFSSSSDADIYTSCYVVKGGFTGQSVISAYNLSTARGMNYAIRIK